MPRPHRPTTGLDTQPMFSLLAALTLYIAFAPVQPALSVGDYLPQTARRAFLPLAGNKDPVLAPAKKDPGRVGIETAAKAVALIDWRTGASLYEKNSATPLPIASLTKLMTALVVLSEDPEWTRSVTMTEDDQQIGDIPLLLPGEEFSVSDLFHLSLIASSNDATAALARSTGFPRQGFLDKMNSLAGELGMTQASFFDVTGLDPRNSASARDIALLVRKALSVDIIRRTVALQAYEYAPKGGAKRRVRSTDQLLDSFLNRPPYEFLGGKTGYIDEAGYCFGAAAQNTDGDRVVAVVLGAASKDERFREVKKLIYWAFDSYTWPVHDEQASPAADGTAER